LQYFAKKISTELYVKNFACRVKNNTQCGGGGGGGGAICVRYLVLQKQAI
jgi:hypothetical protein